jgi:hypothetical protein
MQLTAGYRVTGNRYRTLTIGQAIDEPGEHLLHSDYLPLRLRSFGTVDEPEPDDDFHLCF